MEQAAAPNMFSWILPYAVIFLIFYVLVIRPQKKQQQVLAELKKNVKKNDRVVTTGGIHGTVVSVKEKTVILRVDDNVKIEFDREAISFVEKNEKDES